jgi:PAS domain S-box-containing protein
MRIVDKNFNVLRVNETFSSFSGIKRENAIGKKCHEVFHGPLCMTDACPLTRILNNEDRVECDSDKWCKDGTKIPCIVTATPFKGPDGELIGIVEDLKDISDRKRAEEKLIESRKSLRDLASHLQVVRDEERGRIAREIHDEMGQALTVLKMDLHWLGQRLPDATDVLIGKTMAMSKLIETAIQSLKRICSELRPQLLDDFGLSAAIEWQAEEFGSRTGIEFEIISDQEDIILDHAHSTAIFRIFQETLTNIARHADATRAQVILNENSGVIEMEIRDNGKGINEEQILNPKSFGLIGMRERANFFGGDFRISGNRDKGTTVKVSIPINKERKLHDKNTDR